MKAAILETFDEPFVVEEVELLPPEPDEVIVRTAASVFCITDCINQHGGTDKEPPFITGHSAVGAIEPDQTGLIEFKERWGATTRKCELHILDVRGRAPDLASYYASDGLARQVLTAPAARPAAAPPGGAWLNRWYC